MSLVWELIEGRAREDPGGEYVVFPERGHRWTYAELDRNTALAALGLIDLGVRPGDQVVIWGRNSLGWVACFLAVLRAGGVPVPLNVHYGDHELAEILGLLEPRLVLASPGTRPLGVSCPLLDLEGDLAELMRRGQRLAEAELRRRQELQGPEQLAAMIFTSGTTGLPKGALIAQGPTLRNLHLVGSRMRFGRGDRLCTSLPLFYAFGCLAALLLPLVRGGTLVYLENFAPGRFLEALEAERCTALYAVPTMLVELLDRPDLDRFDLHRLRTGMVAGAPCPPEVFEAAMHRLHLPELCGAYGLTESGPGVSMTCAQDPLPKRLHTVGRPLEGVSLRIVDPRGGRELPPGEVGEVLVGSDMLMRGYYRRPEETARALRDGWLRTGDLGAVDAEGYLRLTGRCKEMIVRGGQKVYPGEVERALAEHPAVQAAQVVGVPSRLWGEDVVAFVRLRNGMSVTPGELRAFCRGRIARYKVPRHFFFVEDFPRTASGKVQKFRLQEMAARRLGRAG